MPDDFRVTKRDTVAAHLRAAAPKVSTFSPKVTVHRLRFLYTKGVSEKGQCGF